MTAASAPRAAKSARKKNRVTPMMRQYMDAKSSHPDALLLFRMGDFYEMFFEDAEQASRVLDLTLTSRDKDKGDQAIPMAGFPHHAMASYVPRLVDSGFKVAICDQVEDPRKAKGLVKRAVTRLITAGTTLEEASLEARRNNYLAAVGFVIEQGVPVFGLCALDASTGEALLSEFRDPLELVETVDRLEVAELLIPQDLDAELRKQIQGLSRRRRIESYPLDRFADVDASGLRSRWPEKHPMDGAAFAAARAAFGYLSELQKSQAEQIGSLAWIESDATLILDSATRRHLDLLRNSVDGKRGGSLLAAVDASVTAMGGRRCARWLAAPSRRVEIITARQQAVQSLVEAPICRDQLRSSLKQMPDVERLTARVVAGQASPRDLGALRRALQLLPELLQAMQDISALQPWADLPCDLDLQTTLERALVDDPPAISREGRFVRPGYDRDIDHLREVASGAKDTLAAIEQRERQRTAIPSLKVRYNKVFGYFIEVTKTHLAKVPGDYIRKQTIANGERYITEELKKLEDEILHADERRLLREHDVLADLIGQVQQRAPILRVCGGRLGELDVLCGFAESAVSHDYVQPEFHDDEDRSLAIEEGRHPVIEQLTRQLGEPFVPNDLKMDCRDRQLLIVTGPNMAGKSTIMRQVALIQILAQAGSFVPARGARLPLCDRIFTRVGASDDVSRGRSTFMVEMTETARILASATADSLVLLDEIGRGTSTFDGLAIAWAVTEHLHDVIGAKTLFATHYHELCQLARELPRVHNVHVAVKEWNDAVHFLRRLLNGSAERSYGIQVARLAQLPATVLDRAKQVLIELEQGDTSGSGSLRKGCSRRRSPRNNQLNLFAGPPADSERLRHRLAKITLDNTTPLQALSLLAELKALVEGEPPTE